MSDGPVSDTERAALLEALEKEKRRAKRANERADVAEKNRAYQRARAVGAEEARDLARLGVGRRDDEIAELKKLVRELEAELLRTK